MPLMVKDYQTCYAHPELIWIDRVPYLASGSMIGGLLLVYFGASDFIYALKGFPMAADSYFDLLLQKSTDRWIVSMQTLIGPKYGHLVKEMQEVQQDLQSALDHQKDFSFFHQSCKWPPAINSGERMMWIAPATSFVKGIPYAAEL